jgi:hypothetical protein
MTEAVRVIGVMPGMSLRKEGSRGRNPAPVKHYNSKVHMVGSHD